MLVTVVGNCQSYPISRMISEAHADWDVAFYQVHLDDISRNPEAYRERIGKSDVILTQPIHDGFRNREDHTLAWIRTNAPREGAIITFPSLYYWADHPTQTVLYSGEMVIQAVQGGSSCYGILALLALAGIEKSVAVRWMLSPDAIPYGVLDLERKSTFEEQLRRESADAIDLKITPFYERFAGRMQLYHIINHPTRITLAYIVNDFFKVLGVPERVEVIGTDYLDGYHFPPLPSVERYYATNSQVDRAIDRSVRNDLVVSGGSSFPLGVCLRSNADAIYASRPELLQAALKNQNLVKFFADHFERVSGTSIGEAARAFAASGG